MAQSKKSNKPYKKKKVASAPMPPRKNGDPKKKIPIPKKPKKKKTYDA